MITLSKSGNSVTFTFDENSGYLQNGTIDVPINSLALITDESDMATFRKSASNDIFISARYDEFGMSKAELEAWYKANMVSSGGGGGVTPEEVQTMIDSSISGKADTSAVTESISAATDDMATQTWVGEQGYITGVDLSNYATLQDIPDVSNYFDGAEYDSGTTRINFYHGNTVKAYIDASSFVIDGMIDDVRIETISGVSYLVIDFNTASGKEDIKIPLTDIFDPSNYYTKSEVDDAITAATDDMATQTWVGEQGYLTEHQSLSAYSTTQEVNTAIEEATSGKADTSAVTAVNNVLTAHTADTTIHVTSADKTAWNAKSDFSGSYNDLTDKPTIPTVPTSNTAFTNDAGYITEDALSGYAESSAVTAEINAATSGKADSTDVQTLSGTVTAHTADTTIHVTSSDKTTWSGKQDALVSGTNIKTINNQSLLGSGNITIQGGGSGSSTVELTQAEYDALVSAGTVSADTYYIITDATPIDISNYYTTAQTQSAITSAVSTKQDTLVSGTNIKTINNESLLGSGNIDIQGGGGGKAIEAGRGISITTGATADTVSFNLPISAGTNPNSLIIGDSYNISSSNRTIATGYNTKAQQSNAFAQGYKTVAGQEQSHAEGYETRANGVNSHSEGRGTSAMTAGSHAEGFYTITSNPYEHTQGQYNVSNKANTTFGDSGNTLFSVGNGTAENARHNAFEIRQNGDIYISSGGTDIKLQDALGGGGGSITIDPTLDSGSTNAVANSAITLAIDTKVDTSAVTSSVTSSSTDVITSGGVYAQLGGLKLQQITQADYDALVSGGTVDASTLYIITNVVN